MCVCVHNYMLSMLIITLYALLYAHCVYNYVSIIIYTVCL